MAISSTVEKERTVSPSANSFPQLAKLEGRQMCTLPSPPLQKLANFNAKVGTLQWRRQKFDEGGSVAGAKRPEIFGRKPRPQLESRDLGLLLVI